MKYILISLITILGFNSLFSQKDTSQFYNKTLSKNNFSVELGGKGGLYSVGYERMLFRSKNFLLTGSVNLSYYRLEAIMLPIAINTLIGEKQNKLLFGLNLANHFNVTPYPKTRKARVSYRTSRMDYRPLYNLAFIQPTVGYRRYFKKGNSLSVAFTPLVLMYLDDAGSFYFDPKETLPWFGISYNFKF